MTMVKMGNEAFDPNSVFWVEPIAQGLRSRGLPKAALSLEAGFSCFRDKVTNENPAKVFRTPAPTSAGLASLTSGYEIDTQRFSEEAHRYAVMHDESHPMVDAFFVTALASFAWADCRIRSKGFLQDAWSSRGPEAAWGALLSLGYLAHPAIALGLSPLALMSLQQRLHARREASKYILEGAKFYMITLHAPESWSALREVARHAMAQGVPLHPVIDLVLGKAERREANDPKSSVDALPIRPPSL